MKWNEVIIRRDNEELLSYPFGSHISYECLFFVPLFDLYLYETNLSPHIEWLCWENSLDTHRSCQNFQEFIMHKNQPMKHERIHT